MASFLPASPSPQGMAGVYLLHRSLPDISGSDALRQREQKINDPLVSACCNEVERPLVAKIRVGRAQPQSCCFIAHDRTDQIHYRPRLKRPLRVAPACHEASVEFDEVAGQCVLLSLG